MAALYCAPSLGAPCCRLSTVGCRLFLKPCPAFWLRGTPGETAIPLLWSPHMGQSQALSACRCNFSLISETPVADPLVGDDFPPTFQAKSPPRDFILGMPDPANSPMIGTAIRAGHTLPFSLCPLLRPLLGCVLLPTVNCRLSAIPKSLPGFFGCAVTRAKLRQALWYGPQLGQSQSPIPSVIAPFPLLSPTLAHETIDLVTPLFSMATSRRPRIEPTMAHNRATMPQDAPSEPHPCPSTTSRPRRINRLQTRTF
jgi:hypothetical protein